jgi:hypothetical protein
MAGVWWMAFEIYSSDVGLPETFLTLAKLYFGLPWRELRIRLESSVLSVSPCCTLSGEDRISKNLYCVAQSRIG